MTISATHLRRLAALNLPAEAMGEVLSILAEVEEGNAELSPGAIRTRRWRDKRASQQASPVTSPVTSPTVTEPVTHAGARAETPTTNSSSTHSKNNKEETKEGAVSAKPRRVACLMPDDFEPSPELIEKAVREWGYSRPQVFEKRDALKDWSHGKNQKRADWNAVLSGALRQDRDRPSTGPPSRPTNGHSPPPLTGYTQVLHDLRRERSEDHAEPTIPLLPRH